MHIVDVDALQPKIMQAGVELMLQIGWRHTMAPSHDVCSLDNAGLEEGPLDVSPKILL
jgi:hypothetical protein